MKRVILAAMLLMLIPSVCLAGIMGKPFGFVGGGWTPLQQTGGGNLPLHYWDPEGINYQDSAGATTIKADGDVTGLLTDYGSIVSGVSQPTTANKPLWKTNILNGRPMWLFDGSNDWLQGPFAASIAQPYTIFIVSKLDPTAVDAGTKNLFAGDDATLDAYSYQRGVAGADAWSMFAGGVIQGVTSDANWNIWTITFNAASSQFWLSGVSSCSPGNAGASGLDGFTLGASKTGASAWKGYIGKILIYGTLSTADKNQIAQYLANHYGISYTAIP